MKKFFCWLMILALLPVWACAEMPPLSLAAFKQQASDWTEEQHSGGTRLWQEGSELYFLPTGELAIYLCSDDRQTSDSAKDIEYDEKIADELIAYCRQFMDDAIPGLNDLIDSFGVPEMWVESDGTAVATLEGGTMEGDRLGKWFKANRLVEGVWFKVHFLPESGTVTRLIAFQLETPVIRKLWEQGLEPQESMFTKEFGGFAVDPRLTEAPDAIETLDVPEGCMSAEEALDIALTYIKQNYGETDASMRRFELAYGIDVEVNGEEKWTFIFDSWMVGHRTQGQYGVTIYARTGEIHFAWDTYTRG